MLWRGSILTSRQMVDCPVTLSQDAGTEPASSRVPENQYSATWCFRNRPSGPASLFLISSQETGHLASQFLRSNKKLSLRNLATRCRTHTHGALHLTRRDKTSHEPRVRARALVHIHTSACACAPARFTRWLARAQAGATTQPAS